MNDSTCENCGLENCKWHMTPPSSVALSSELLERALGCLDRTRARALTAEARAAAMKSVLEGAREILGAPDNEEVYQSDWSSAWRDKTIDALLAKIAAIVEEP